jgi:hypothetical protein
MGLDLLPWLRDHPAMSEHLTEEPLSRNKRITFSLILALLTIGLCLVLGEAWVRLFMPQSDLRHRDLFFRYEAFVGAEGIPDKTGIFANRSFKTIVEHNSEGLRDTEHTKANTTGRFRILTIGDSFTWGHGVNNDEIYMKVLEQLDDRVETVNLGGPGGDPPSELKVYLSRGKAYEHDVVLMGFYIGNDIVTRRASPTGSPPRWGFNEQGEFALIGVQKTPEQVAQRRRESEARYAADAERSASEEASYWLRRNSHLFTLVGNGRDYASEVMKGSTAYTTIASWFGQERERRHFPFLDYCQEEDSDEIAYGWKLLEATLRRLKQEAEAEGARPYILFIPDMYQTWTEYYETTARRYGYDPHAYDLDKPSRVLGELCDDIEIACLDLVPMMRDLMGEGTELYYRRDRHWTPEGHRVAGQALQEDLERRGWLD